MTKWMNVGRHREFRSNASYQGKISQTSSEKFAIKLKSPFLILLVTKKEKKRTFPFFLELCNEILIRFFLTDTHKG